MRSKKSLSAKLLIMMLMLLAQVMVSTVAWASSANIVILSPSSGQVFTSTNGPTIQVRGYVGNISASTLTVNGKVVPFDTQGNWSTTITLSVGTNTIKVEAGGTKKELIVYYNDGAPDVEITAPAHDYEVVYTNSVSIDANITGGTLSDVYLDGNSLGVTALPYSVNLTPGLHTIIVEATNSSGTLSATDEIHVIYDDAPRITVDAPANGDKVTANSVTVTGTSANASSLEFYLNGTKKTTLSVTGTNYNQIVSGLKPGDNTIEIKAISGLRVTSKTISIEYSPANQVLYELAYGNGSIAYSDQITFSGKVTNTTKVRITNTNLTPGSGYGNPSSPIIRTVTSSDYFSGTLNLNLGLNTIEVVDDTTGIPIGTVDITFEERPLIDIEEPWNLAATYTSVVDSTRTVTTDQITIKGDVANVNSLKYKLRNGTETSLSYSGNHFSRTFDLEPGLNKIEIIAASKYGKTATYTFNISYQGGPRINIITPTDISVPINVNDKNFTLIGNAEAADKVTLELKTPDHTYTYTLTPDSKDNFSKTLTLEKGTNTITIEATKGSNNTAKATEVITVNYGAMPTILIYQPIDGEIVEDNEVVVKGKVVNVDSSGLRINDEKVSFNSNGEFTATIEIDPDNPNLTVRASNGTQIAEKIIKLDYQGEPQIIVTNYDDNDTVYKNQITLKGKVIGLKSTMLPVSIQIGKETIDLDEDDDFEFSQEYTLKKGTNTIKLQLKGNNVKGVKKSLKIAYEEVAVDGAKYIVNASSKGGTVKLFDKEFELEYPKGYLSEDDKIEVEVVDYDNLDVDSGHNTYIGKIFYLDVPEIAESYEISIKFDQNVSARAAHRLAIFKYNSSRDEWESVGGKVDFSKKMITTKIDEEGYYAAMLNAKTFNDIGGHWAQESIEMLVAKGVVEGEDNEYFGPNNKLTREQLAKMIVKGMKYKIMDEEYVTFYDVRKSRWSHRYVQTAVRMGIVKGVGDNRFDGSRAVTRAELMVMLARAASLVNNDTEQVNTTIILSQFTDGDKVPYYARDAFAQLVNAGYIKGDEYGKLNPFATATRAEAANVLAAIMDNKGLI